MNPSDRKKILALDGGGIRGVLSLGILAEIEKLVGKPLGEYFDYIGGTSTGAIISAGLSLGMKVADLQKFYSDFGEAMFEPRFLLSRYKSLYASDPLRDQLKKTFGANTTIGSRDKIKTLLLAVTRNWTTDSPWPISNNPNALYNDTSRKDCNLNIPLWQLVRASTAAPVFFPPEVINWDPADSSKSFVFVDGGVTPYNNPAFVLFRMATSPYYGLNWQTGEDNLLIISVGTGSAPKSGAVPEDPDQSIPAQIPGLISALMYAAEIDQDVNCRTIGRCVYGGIIDREVGDMIPREGDYGPRPLRLADRLATPKIPLDKPLGRAFRYARYNPELTDEGMKKLGVTDYNLSNLLKMDYVKPDNVAKLAQVGAAEGKNVSRDHFGLFL
jgi:predicted acylesterase/phospholipase RssA